MEGRVIDIYNRVTAPSKAFFIPLDNEVSERYLRWVFIKARLVKKKISITRYTVIDKKKKYIQTTDHIAIYTLKNKDRAVLYRHFIKSENGSICELDEEVPFTADEHPFLKVWPSKDREEVKDEGVEKVKLVREEQELNLEGVYDLEMDDNSRINDKYLTESERRLISKD